MAVADRHIVVTAIVSSSSVLAVQSNSCSIDYGGAYSSISHGAVPGFSVSSAGTVLTIGIVGTGPSYSNWIANNTYSLTITCFPPFGASEDGLVYIHLRTIPLHFLIEKNSTTTLMLPAVNTNSLSLTAPGGEISATVLGDTATIAKAAAASWSAVDSEFDVTVSLHAPGSGLGYYDSDSHFNVATQRPIRCLRQLVSGGATDLAGYNWIKYQQSSAAAINTNLPAGVVVHPSGAVTLPVLNNSTLSIEGVSGAITYPTSETFNLDFGVVPVTGGYLLSVAHGGIRLCLREVTGSDISDGGSNYDANFDFDDAQAIMTLGGGAETWTLDNIVASGGSGLVVSSHSSTGDNLTVNFVSPLHDSDDRSFLATVHSSDAHPPSIFPVDMNVDGDAETLGVNPSTLPNGTPDAGYSVPFATVSADGVDGTFSWALTGAENVSVGLSLNSATGELSGTIPVGWAGTTKTVEVTVTETLSGVTVGTGTATYTLTINAESTDKTTDAVILLDRSGTMSSGVRWPAAISGAHSFANLVKQQNDDEGTHHRVAVLWFGGWGPYYASSGAQAAKYNYIPTLPGDHNNDLGAPEGGKNFGTLGALDFAEPTDAMLATINGASGTTLPFGTAVASGLLHARDRLLAGPAENNKVVLCLSDGMENRCPMIDEVFTITPTAGFGWGTNKIKVCSIALDTSSGWADKLREVSTHANGISDSDNVKTVSTAAEAGAAGAWFTSRFAAQFGWTPVVVPGDPPIRGGQSIHHKVRITSAEDKFVFTANLNDVLPNTGMGGKPAWTLTLIPPGGDGSITQSTGGVTFSSGPMYERVSVKLPLALSGFEHEWIGQWTVVVSCNVEGRHGYVPSAFTKLRRGESPVMVSVNVVQENRGTASALARITQNGNALSNAKVTGLVAAPGQWPGLIISKHVEAAMHPLKRPMSLSAFNHKIDRGTAAENSYTALSMARELPKGTDRSLRFTFVSQLGAYRARFDTPYPGTYVLHTVIDGQRRCKKTSVHLLEAYRGMSRYYSGALYAKKIKAISRISGLQQQFHQEKQTIFVVKFKPSVKTSEVSGTMLDNKRLRLSVTPKDEGGVLFGPGWAHAVHFKVPFGNQTRLRAQDAGTGTYYVDVKCDFGTFPVLDPIHRIVSSNNPIRLETLNRIVRIPGRRLPLCKFGVEVLGVKISIPVTAPLFPIKPGTFRPLERSTLQLAATKLEKQLAAAQKDKETKPTAAQKQQFAAIYKVLARTSSRISVPTTRGAIVAAYKMRTAVTYVNRFANQFEDSRVEDILGTVSEIFGIILDRHDAIGRHNIGDITNGFYEDLSSVSTHLQTLLKWMKSVLK